MSLSLPREAHQFLKWLELTQGRDKLYRLVQYGSKFVIQQMKEHGGDKDTIDRLSKGASAVGMTRKLMRFFRSVEYMNEFLKAVNVKDEFERYVSMLKAASLFVWMVADHIQWLNKAGYLKLGATPKIDEVHSKGNDATAASLRCAHSRLPASRGESASCRGVARESSWFAPHFRVCNVFAS
jgi:hypothetical protein